MNKDDVLAILSRVKYPGMERNIVEYGVVRHVAACENVAKVELEVLARDDRVPQQLREAVEAALRAAGLDATVKMDVKRFPSVGANPGAMPAGGPQWHGGRAHSHAPAGPHGTSPDPWADRQRIAGVRHVVAVASGKGGVGKSTVAVNLAAALAARGLAVGLLDCDIYGPSQPIMLGITDPKIEVDQDNNILPIVAHGVATMSIGYLLDDEQPVIWRGPLVMKTIEQFLRGVKWGNLDVLVIDLPPGTGDAQLSLVQKTPIDGVVIVTTPQDVALADVIRGHAMFEKVGVPTLGVIENMSYFVAPDTGKRYDIFGHGGGRATAEKRGLRFLGELPIDPAVREACDQGVPIVVGAPGSAAAKSYAALAASVLDLLA